MPVSESVHRPPQLLLAPMQGLVDDVMRTILTEIGGFDGCVTEFVRITHTIHGRQTWLKYMPEIKNQNKTPSGTPVAIQLLGSDADNMVQNALYAVNLGINHIDLNFGCPAPTVNQHQGGAILLREPKRIEHIVSTIRQHLPAHIFLSAKMRLGYEHKDLALDCARAIENGGAQQLTVHARTKIEGYQPPAHWEWIRRIREIVALPLVANGDVFSLDDYQRIRQISQCDDVMLGRGAVMMPDLARQIAAFNRHECIEVMPWSEVVLWLEKFLLLCSNKNAASKYPSARLKQWLAMLKQHYPEAEVLFNLLRTLTTITDIQYTLQKYIATL